MALYVSYVVGSSVALYIGRRIFGGVSREPEIVEVESSSNKYIVIEGKDNIEIMGLKVDELDELEDDLYRCIKCDNMLKLSLYSNRQRKKDKGLWKCKVCSKLQ